MKKKINNYSLIRTIFLIMILSVTILMISIITLTIMRSYKKYYNDIELIRSSSLNQQKRKIKYQVEKVVFYIQQMIKFNQQLPENKQMPPEELQDYLLNELKDLRFDKDGYFFGSTSDGGPLFSNGKITLGTGNIWNIADPNGVMIIQKQLEALNTPEGVFLEYYWQRLNETSLSPKISFTMAIPAWKWIVGTGVYLDDINTIISQKKAELKKRLFDQINEYVFLLLVYLLISYFIIKQISGIIKKNIASLSLFFTNAAEQYETIDLELLYYPEFRSIAASANKMIDKRKLIEDALKISEYKYRQLINTTSEGFWMIDKLQNTIEVNESICRMLDYSSREMIGKSPQFFMDDQNISIFQNKSITQSKIAHSSYEINLIKKSGENLPCFVKATNLFDENNECVATFAFITDITDRKTYEEKLNNYRNHLEELVQERTTELETKNRELERYNKLFIGREFRIKELRDKVKFLEEKLQK